MALTDVRVVFIDDGGVLNDNERRAPEWRRLLGEYLPPRLGGTPQAWAEANRAVFERSWARFVERMRTGSYRGLEAWLREDRERWLVEMCDAVGVAAPPDPRAFALATSAWVSERVRAAIPGAVETVHWLADRGHTLHMASGALSWELEPTLRGMGIRTRFDRLYGPDLVDAAKSGPHYYEAIVADSGVDPKTAVVVDDLADAHQWARSVGLRTFGSLADLKTALA